MKMLRWFLSEGDKRLELRNGTRVSETKAAEALLEKIDEKTEALQALDLHIDRKIAELEKLISMIESMQPHHTPATGMRHREIAALARRGLQSEEIARALEMPRGEVELVLGLAGVARR